MIVTAPDSRGAISEQGVMCLMCGEEFRHLTNTHLGRHGLTSIEYKERFGYNRGRPLMVDSVRRTHVTNAVRAGLALHIRRQAFVVDPDFHRKGGQRPHRLEEHLNRQEREGRSTRRFPRDGRGRFVSPRSAIDDIGVMGRSDR